MNNSQFCKNFRFILHTYTHYYHADNRGGLPYHYIARLKNGTARLVTQYRSTTFQTGDIFYIPQGLSYQSYWYGGKNDVVELDSIGFGTFPDSSEKKYLLQKIDLNTDQSNMLDIITSNYNIDCKNVGILYQLLSSLLDTMTFEPFSKDEQILQSAREYMHNNINYSIAEVAKYCNICESSLYTVFRKNCGCTPIDEKHKIIGEKATELLQTTDMPISNIMEMLGFSSAPYFRKIIFKATGKSPREIRKENSLRL